VRSLLHLARSPDRSDARNASPSRRAIARRPADHPQLLGGPTGPAEHPCAHRARTLAPAAAREPVSIRARVALQLGGRRATRGSGLDPHRWKGTIHVQAYRRSGRCPPWTGAAQTRFAASARPEKSAERKPRERTDRSAQGDRRDRVLHGGVLRARRRHGAPAAWRGSRSRVDRRAPLRAYGATSSCARSSPCGFRGAVFRAGSAARTQRPGAR